MRAHTSLRLLAAVSILSTCVAAQAAHAVADDYLDMSPEQLLDAQVISVSKRPEKLSETPAAIYVITGEDIARSGVTTIPEALRMAPGVDVARADSNSWAISIRGLNSTLANKLLVMIDGRAVYNPLFGGTYWELQDLPLSTIDRIEIIRGPGGTLWGANAVDGVINIITKPAALTQGTHVSALYGNTEKSGTVTQGGRAGDMFFRLYGKHSDYASFDRPDGTPGHDAWRDSRGGFRGDWGENFTLQGDIYQNDAQQRFNSTSLTPPYNSLVDETMDSHGLNLMGRWHKEMDNGGEASVLAYADYTYRSQLLGKEVRLISNVEGQYNFPVTGAHEVIAGINYRNTSDSVTAGPTIALDPRTRSDNLYGFFLQDRIELVPDKWFLTLGTKFEHNDYSGFEYQPNARLQWLIDPTRTAWAAVSRAVRTPTRAEFDFNAQVTAVNTSLLALPAEVVLQANRDFESEKLVAYETGYRQEITPDLSLDGTLFYNMYNDLETVDIQDLELVNNGVDPLHYLLPIQTSNNSKAIVKGGELAMTWRAAPNWRLSGAYSLLNTTIFVDQPTLPVNLKGAEGSSPEQQFNIRSSWNITDDVSLDTNIYYVDQLQAQDVNQYVRFDANLGWKIMPGVRFDLAGQNLLKSEHREFNTADSVNAAEIPRSVYGQISWDF
jgi:iron complex outermembrane receptor protein